MKSFGTYHPLVIASYFIFVFFISCLSMHPISLGIHFVSAVLLTLCLSGIKKTVRLILTLFPVGCLSVLMNVLFNHNGITILAYFPNGNPLTKESLIYALCAALMLITVILWCSALYCIMTSDMLIYLCGRAFPSLALMVSMALHFVPEFCRQWKVIANGQACIGKNEKTLKNTLRIFSILITRSLENAMDTADSMKSRGFGLMPRTSFSHYVFSVRNGIMLGILLFLGVYIMAGIFGTGFCFQYFPQIKAPDFSFYSLSLWLSEALLFLLPVILSCWEEHRWTVSRSKI